MKAGICLEVTSCLRELAEGTFYGRQRNETGFPTVGAANAQ
jgi:hypothetical protein